MATTHTEIYRRFQGRLRPAAWGALPLAQAGIRTALKNKRAWLLFVPPFIATVIFSFIVYAKFALEAGMAPGPLGQGNPSVALAGALAGKLIEVRDQIVQFNIAMSTFSLLIVGWYGAGLIAEDRRLGAQLLYFARPLTLADYLLGKFLVAGFFGLAGVLIPGLTICIVATFASPNWSFVRHEGSVIVATLAYALLYVATLASLVLAVSSLSGRKTFALVAVFGFFVLSHGVGLLLASLQRESLWLTLSPQANLPRIAKSLFDVSQMQIQGVRLDWDVGTSWLVLGATLACAWTLLALRVRRMEAVA